LAAAERARPALLATIPVGCDRNRRPRWGTTEPEWSVMKVRAALLRPCFHSPLAGSSPIFGTVFRQVERVDRGGAAQVGVANEEVVAAGLRVDQGEVVAHFQIVWWIGT
jgi:hypothetical protein